MIRAKVGESTYTFNNELEQYFANIKRNIIGDQLTFSTPYGQQKLLYADWTASGRLYKNIEVKMSNTLGPYVGNTHTESNVTGTYMTKAYHEAKEIIKKHVNANENDIILFEGFGMTGAVNKLQRLLGLKDRRKELEHKAVVFVTHMEHHSNYLPWIETNAEVCMIQPDRYGDVDETELIKLIELYADREIKIGAFTACSNVTGRKTNYHQLAKIMHQHGGLCFIDFAASAPYVSINMHPNEKTEELDAIFFSPHKFLGGPGTSGVLIMSKNLIESSVPDIPGGGTVDFTNPWGDLIYKEDIEEREDGGTPGFLQAIKIALCIQLKEKMGIERIQARERELISLVMTELRKMEGINVFEEANNDRLGIISFTCKEIHYDLVVRLLNDRFGIQVRGGCSCAGPYGHYLLDITHEKSKKLIDEIKNGDFSHKPGWIRLSLHPTMSNEEAYYILSAMKKILYYHKEWSKDYQYENRSSTYRLHKNMKIDSLFG
ncbi:aminotransferase class V-fold PLP-dependent enzyme [Bacillus sp. B1-b2]|uniref:aminotransferase class V-fold PLP-dependent enzyme n=1 Tax=Bacillus sp. B1-b2 TaxID=2653201 RepID=UPI0012615533|nr:aminotransferase class V-fold PLP-dependent enzyme [Bacillus sp. B1-b2]KAB7671281.1 aminotransferase class V-fold PLP-dependent enzyme [Bacillus sp. B1-b2]